MYSFIRCSCGSSIPKPTERPPPSRQPRFAASITPGPPPVTTAQPASPKSRAVSRASSYAGDPSRDRAEPKQETAGRSIRSTASNPARNSSPIDFARQRRYSSEWCDWRSSRSSIDLEHPALPRGEQAGDECRRDEDVEARDAIGLLAVGSNRFDRDAVLVADPASPRLRDGAEDAAAVEEADREQIEGVEQEPDVREHHEPRRALGGADGPGGGRAESADARTGE